MSLDPELNELLNTLVHGRTPEQINAGRDIFAFGKEAVIPLLDLLANPENSHCWWLIAEALGAIGDCHAVEPLIALLKSPQSHDALLARKYTAWALGGLHDPRAVDVLIEMLHEKDLCEEEGWRPEEPAYETIEAAIWALTEIGDERALAPIVQRLLDEDYYMDGESLNEWGEPAFALLVEGLSSEDDHRRADAASLLGEFGDSRAVPLLIDRLQQDPSDRVRQSAVYGLADLRDPRAFDALVAALDDPNQKIRMHGAIGLGYLDDVRAVDVLEKAALDEDQAVRYFANDALTRIKKSPDG